MPTITSKLTQPANPTSLTTTTPSQTSLSSIKSAEVGSTPPNSSSSCLFFQSQSFRDPLAIFPFEKPCSNDCAQIWIFTFHFQFLITTINYRFSASRKYKMFLIDYTESVDFQHLESTICFLLITQQVWTFRTEQQYNYYFLLTTQQTQIFSTEKFLIYTSVDFRTIKYLYFLNG